MTQKKRKFIKIGTLVRFERRNGEVGHGRVAGTDDRINGRWVAVNTAPKGQNPKIAKVRESAIHIG